MQKSPGQPGGQAAMEQNEKATVSTGARTQRLYNVAEIGTRFDKLRASAMKPLDATVYDLRDRLMAFLREGFSIADTVAMLREAGIDATDRQIRYAMAKAGISGRGKKRSQPTNRRQQSASNDSTTDKVATVASTETGAMDGMSQTDASAETDNKGASADTQPATTADSPVASLFQQLGQKAAAAVTNSDSKTDKKRQQINGSSAASGPAPAPAEQNLTPEEQAELADFDNNNDF